jgi:membrane protein DedA with SNARE-associated domain/rhodanese-related sulfurtransferase
MNQILSFLAEHGSAVLFAVVLIEQLGLPLPSLPWIIAAGAMAADGKINLPATLTGIVAACLIADCVWFKLGQHGGARMMGVLCRISLQPDTCVRRTRSLFDRHGMRSVIAAKFIPGLSAIVSPLAGMSGVKLQRFLFFDAIGSLLHGSVYLLVGVLFRHQLDHVISTLARLGNWGLILIASAIIGYIGFRYFQRRRLLRHLRIARIDVAEVRRRQIAGEPLSIFDLRSRAELELDPQVISGARRVDYDELIQHGHELARDRDIYVYCSCPNEISSASITLDLQRQGVSRVRPIIGGIDAWRERHYPTEQWSTAEAPVLTLADLPLPSPIDTAEFTVIGNHEKATEEPWKQPKTNRKA